MLYLFDIWKKQNDATIKTQELILDSEHIYDWQYMISPKKLFKNRISIIAGPRQVGKSNFLKQLARKLYDSEYISNNDYIIIMGVSVNSLIVSGLLQYLLADRMKGLADKISIINARTLKDLAYQIQQIRCGTHKRFVFLIDNVECIRNITLQDILQDHETFRKEDYCILMSNCYPGHSFFIQCQLSPEVATYRLRSAS